MMERRKYDNGWLSVAVVLLVVVVVRVMLANGDSVTEVRRADN